MIFKTIFAVFMVGILLLPILSSAYELLAPLPSATGDLSVNVTLESYLQWLFKFILIGTGFLAVLMIVIGGVRYMIGGAKESERSEGKKQISSALWGLLLAFGAWLILYTINPELLKLSFTSPKAEVQINNNPND